MSDIITWFSSTHYEVPKEPARHSVSVDDIEEGLEEVAEELLPQPFRGAVKIADQTYKKMRAHEEEKKDEITTRLLALEKRHENLESKVVLGGVLMTLGAGLAAWAHRDEIQVAGEKLWQDLSALVQDMRYNGIHFG